MSLRYAIDRGEINIGNLDRTHLCVRWYAPQSFMRYEPESGVFRWSWRDAVNPMNWWRAVSARWNWDVSCGWYRGMNHRCYCPVGVSFDGRICVAGFGVNWWYSRFYGQVPCVCDDVLSQFDVDDDESIVSVESHT